MLPYWYTYEVALGWNNIPDDETDNFEAYFEIPLRGKRVPRGAVTKTTLDKHRHTSGNRSVSLETEGCLYSELDAYVNAIHGGWEPDEESVDVTLRWRDRANDFHYYNAVAHLPLDGENYEHITTQLVRDVRLDFDIIEDLSDP